MPPKRNPDARVATRPSRIAKTKGGKLITDAIRGIGRQPAPSPPPRQQAQSPKQQAMQRPDATLFDEEFPEHIKLLLQEATNQEANDGKVLVSKTLISWFVSEVTSQRQKNHRLESLPHAPILALSHEVISIIFTFLSNHNTEERWPPFNELTMQERLLLQPILVVRQVCRHFRAIANTLPFWYSDTFEPVALISNFCGIYRPRESAFLKSLLMDKGLVTCLRRKRQWSFRSFQPSKSFLKEYQLFEEISCNSLLRRKRDRKRTGKYIITTYAMT